MALRLSSNEKTALQALTITASALSFCGSIFIGCTYWRFKELRNFAFRLVLMIAIADGIRSFANLWGDPQGVPFICPLQGFLKVYGGLASFLWVTVIAHVIDDVFRHSTEDSGILFLRDREKYFHAFAWGGSGIAAILPLFTDSYGAAGAWCFLRGGAVKHEVWRWVSYYVILWIVCGYMAFVYCRLYRTFDKEVLEQNQTLKRVRFYPLILVVCFTFGTIRRLMNATNFGDVPYGIILIHHITASLYGFCNAIAYGLTPHVRSTYHQWWTGSGEATAAEMQTPTTNKVADRRNIKYTHSRQESDTIELGKGVAGINFGTEDSD